MTIWLVRAGSHGEREQFALDNGYAVIGWDELGDLSKVQSRESLEELMRQAFPDSKRAKIAHHVGQVWAFLASVQEGDIVALPLKTRAAIAFGKFKGAYEFHPDWPEGAHHVRKVSWITTDIPRSAVDQDILYSLGAFMTVCRISRNQAEERIKALLDGKHAPPSLNGSGHETEDVSAPPDLEQFSEDQIRTRIGQRFRGHELARLVDEMLKAEGYETFRSAAGPDGGMDILAGRGPMGFDVPRLCVQVKSSDSPADVGVLRELQGVMGNFGAEQGLLVAWGGFKQSVLNEARRLYFQVRLWDSGDVVTNFLQRYSSLPADVQAEVPLKRIWVVVPEEV